MRGSQKKFLDHRVGQYSTSNIATATTGRTFMKPCMSCRIGGGIAPAIRVGNIQMGQHGARERRDADHAEHDGVRFEQHRGRQCDHQGQELPQVEPGFDVARGMLDIRLAMTQVVARTR